MTKQEQIEEMAKIVDEMYNVYTTTADDIADGLYNAGYRKVDDFEAEDERLREVIRQLNTDYNRAWERLKSDCREIGELKAENKRLKTECALLDDELRIARQETINVLNELKTKAFDKDAFNGWAGSTFVVLVRDIDKMIEELTKCRR